MVKNPSANAGDMGSIPGSGRSPGEGNDNPLQCSCVENPIDKRSLVGFSLWGQKELDTTEQLTHIHTHTHTHTHMVGEERCLQTYGLIQPSS